MSKFYHSQDSSDSFPPYPIFYKKILGEILNKYKLDKGRIDIILTKFQEKIESLKPEGLDRPILFNEFLPHFFKQQLENNMVEKMKNGSGPKKYDVSIHDHPNFDEEDFISCFEDAIKGALDRKATSDIINDIFYKILSSYYFINLFEKFAWDIEKTHYALQKAIREAISFEVIDTSIFDYTIFIESSCERLKKIVERKLKTYLDQEIPKEAAIIKKNTKAGIKKLKKNNKKIDIKSDSESLNVKENDGSSSGRKGDHEEEDLKFDLEDLAPFVKDVVADAVFAGIFYKKIQQLFPKRYWEKVAAECGLKFNEFDRLMKKALIGIPKESLVRRGKLEKSVINNFLFIYSFKSEFTARIKDNKNFRIYMAINAAVITSAAKKLPSINFRLERFPDVIEEAGWLAEKKKEDQGSRNKQENRICDSIKTENDIVYIAKSKSRIDCVHRNPHSHLSSFQSFKTLMKLVDLNDLLKESTIGGYILQSNDQGSLIQEQNNKPQTLVKIDDYDKKSQLRLIALSYLRAARAYMPLESLSVFFYSKPFDLIDHKENITARINNFWPHKRRCCVKAIYWTSMYQQFLLNSNLPMEGLHNKALYFSDTTKNKFVADLYGGGSFFGRSQTVNFMKKLGITIPKPYDFHRYQWCCKFFDKIISTQNPVVEQIVDQVGKNLTEGIH